MNDQNFTTTFTVDVLILQPHLEISNAAYVNFGSA